MTEDIDDFLPKEEELQQSQINLQSTLGSEYSFSSDSSFISSSTVSSIPSTSVKTAPRKGVVPLNLSKNNLALFGVGYKN